MVKKEEEEIQLGQLPDEILVLILSRLTISEAARTSVLSRRWENLWKNFVGDFDFRHPYYSDTESCVSVSHSCFFGIGNDVNWVNHVLDSHRGPTLNSFRVAFHMDKSWDQHLHSWVRFASKRGVKMLQLDFGFSPSKDNCTFPPNLDSRSFKNLSSLSLSCVDITDQALAHLLTSCPLLEQLALRYCLSVIDVKLVAGPSLKHLEIVDCPNMKSMAIDAANLESLEFFGEKIAVPLMNVPSLTHLAIGGTYCHSLVSGLGSSLLSANPSHLERLVWDLTDMGLKLPILVFARGFPEFGNLRDLELRLGRDIVEGKSSFLYLTSLIEACPKLINFRLEVSGYGPHYFWIRNLPKTWRWLSRRERISEASINYLNESLAVRDPSDLCSGFGFTMATNFPLGNSRHQQRLCKGLKRVDFCRFTGHPAELELATHLLENAPLLERVTIDPYSPRLPRCYWLDTTLVEVGRERAKRLKTNLPQGAELVIL